MKNKEKKSVRTLAVAKKNGKLLLGRKKKEGFGYAKWNGLGGKVEHGETVDQAMIRECIEEGFIEPVEYSKKGIISFHYPDEPIHEVHIYEITEFSGDPNDSDEMEVAWHGIDIIPYKEMWESDEYWWPLFLSNKLFAGDFYFDKDYKIINHNLDLVDEVETYL